MIAAGGATPATWLHGAYATRRHRSIAEARAFLIRAEGQLEENATFHFNLACYESQLGNMEAAAARLTRAITLDPGLKAAALDEPDLWPIW